MFVNFKNNSVLDQLEVLPNKFYLTGSTYFVGSGNDLDFFTEFTPDIEQTLIMLGFRAVSTSNYQDSHCCGVYRQKKIDIQLVRDAELKERIQQKFKASSRISPTTDEWNLAFELLK